MTNLPKWFQWKGIGIRESSSGRVKDRERSRKALLELKSQPLKAKTCWKDTWIVMRTKKKEKKKKS